MDNLVIKVFGAATGALCISDLFLCDINQSIRDVSVSMSMSVCVFVSVAELK